MKKKSNERIDFDKRFRNEKLERRQWNFLVGGDGDGGQPGTGDPWDPPD